MLLLSNTFYFNIPETILSTRFSFILTNDGILFACGKNKFGILGVSDHRAKYKPTKIAIPIKVVKVDFHDNTAICLSEEGKVFTWGKNSHGIKQDLSYKFIDSSVPIEVDMLTSTKVVDIGAADSHFYAITHDRVNLLTWGKLFT